jgi:putative glutamine amidotransferase
MPTPLARRPRIIIPPDAVVLSSRMDGRGAFCALSYSEAILAAGGLPVILPLTANRRVLQEFLDDADGLLLIGGGDVNPRRYGGRPHPKISGVDDTRDEMEIHLCRAARRRDLPTLGICRGIQIINVAFGGTLHPHITGHAHPQPTARVHRLRWGRGWIEVNSSHHQAVDRVAPGFVVTARAADGTVEAMELPAARHLRAVQFHPERLVAGEPGCRRLFAEFLRATNPGARR